MTKLQLGLFDMGPHDGYGGGNLPPLKAKSLAQIEQERADRLMLATHERLQSKLPHCLRYDDWELWGDPDGYRVCHAHTGLETAPHRNARQAIDEAIRIAAFFELLPMSELRRMDRGAPDCYTRLPAHLAVRYKYDSRIQPRRWLAEFDRRHAADKAVSA